MRHCGSCNVCCIELEIEDPELSKPGCSVCPNLKSNQCSIYHNKPKQCTDFNCSWLLGYGEEDLRPDMSGLMVFPRMFNGGTWIVAIEVEQDGLQKGYQVAVDVADHYRTVVIVKKYQAEIDTGDYTIIRNTDLNRTDQMRGDFIKWLDNDKQIGLYQLINSGA